MGGSRRQGGLCGGGCFQKLAVLALATTTTITAARTTATGGGAFVFPSSSSSSLSASLAASRIEEGRRRGGVESMYTAHSHSSSSSNRGGGWFRSPSPSSSSTSQPRPRRTHSSSIPLWGSSGKGGEGVGGVGGYEQNRGFRQLSPADFAANFKPEDVSGNPAKRAEIARVLPGVNVDKLCKEVPDVLLWSSEELQARMDVLAEAMPGQDLVKAVSEAPTILIGTPYLKKTLEQFAKWFPGKTLPELMPKYTDSSMGTAPRSLTYPKRLDWEVPYLDPGLMGNYSVQTELVEAMRRSQHMVFGLWKEDEEALSKFVGATRRAVLAFETRVFFLRDYYPQEHFERYYADDLFGETTGFTEDWSKKHPGYDAYMDEKLAGYQGMESFRLKRMPVGEKEEMLIQARAEGVLGPDGAFMGRALPLPGSKEEEEEDDGWDDLGVEDVMDTSMGGGEEEEDDEFVQAMQQALWVFEVRAGFLERLFGTEVYRNEVIRRVRKETAGTSEEFVERFPAYLGHLHEVLDGWAGMTSAEWEKVTVNDKEDQLVEMLKARGRAMVNVQQKMMSFRPEPIPHVIKERAVESREEARAKLAAEDEAALEALSDEEVKKHWEAYEEYVKKRFPSLQKDIETMHNSRGLFEDEEGEEEEDEQGEDDEDIVGGLGF